MNQAKKCALALRGGSESDDTDHCATISCISNALAHIIQTASYIAEMARNDPEVGSISLAIYARTLPLTPCSAKGSLHTLWGPVIDQSSTPTRRPNSDLSILIPRTQEDIAAKIVQVPSSPISNHSFNIPDGTAAQCLYFFIDASGNTVHPSTMKERSLEGINSRAVSSALKAVFRAHKRNLSAVKRKTSGLRYKSLLPHFLRNCGATVVLPKVILSRDIKGRPYRVIGYETIKLEIEKSDRNSKVMNFALLSTLLYSKPPGLPILDELGKISHSGCGPGGCISWPGCDNENCKDKPRSTNSFFLSIDNRKCKIGFGVVDPFSTFISGKEVPMDSLIVRFHSFYEPNVSEIPLSLKSRISNCMPTIWPKIQIGRAKILGEFENQILGSAVLVSMYPINRMSLPCEERSSPSQAVFSHVSNAVFLCDLIIDERKDHDLPYPYMGWYYPKSLQNLRKYHFHGSIIPQTIGEIPKSAAFLWHRERIGCNDIVLDSSQ